MGRNKRIVVGATVLLAATCIWVSTASSQERSFLGAAAVDHQLLDGRGTAIAQIRRGDLLTVLVPGEDRDLVQTVEGKKGWVASKNLKRLADAAKIYDDLIRAQPQESTWYARRAMVWEQRGDSQKAVADLDRAIQLGNKDAHLFANRGMYRAAAGDFDGAIADYGEALKRGIDEAFVYSNRAAAYLAKGDFKRAIDDCNEVIRREPEKATAFYLRGVAWRQSDDLDKALQDFSAAIRLQPENVQARLSRGFIYYLKDSPQQAIGDFSEVIRSQPEHAVAFNNRGFNLQILGKFNEALADYDEAIRLAPDYALAYQNKGWLLATCSDDRMRNGRLALATATKACELREWKVPSDWKALAAAYAETGDFANAVKWQGKVVEAMEGDAQQPEQEILAEYEQGKPHRVGVER